jgi:hypothetical protein
MLRPATLDVVGLPLVEPLPAGSTVDETGIGRPLSTLPAHTPRDPLLPVPPLLLRSPAHVLILAGSQERGPDSAWNEDLLRRAGFDEVELVWGFLNFRAWVAIRR